ncbi:MAG: S1C family serine protease [Desulfomonilaceae bacterium]
MARPKRVHASRKVVLVAALFALCIPSNLKAAAGTVAAARGGCPDFIELIKELTPSVVTIAIQRHLLQSESPAFSRMVTRGEALSDLNDLSRGPVQSDTLGSGFICDDSGLIVTNAHVVEGAGKIMVTLSTGKVLQAKVVSLHPKVDLALIKIEPPYELKKAKIGDSSRVQVGEWVLAVGNPFGLGRTVTVGIVSGKGRFLGLGPDDDFIQTDASINPGNSGGPLFNAAGEVIGVNTAIIASGKGIGFSIPSNYIHELLHKSRTNAPTPRGWLGLYVADLDETTAKELGLEGTSRPVVDEVIPDAPAHRAGVCKGDVILKVEGQPATNGRQLSKIVGASKPGDTLRLTILRAQHTYDLDVVLGKSPD